MRYESQERDGLTLGVQHNLQNTFDTLKNTGKGDNNVSKGSSVLRTVDAIDQFTSGPSYSGHLGNTKTSTEIVNQYQEARGSNLTAGRDVAVSAGETVELKAANVGANRDITWRRMILSSPQKRTNSSPAKATTTSKTGTNLSASKQSASIGQGRTTQENDSENTQRTGQGSQLIAGRPD